MKTETVLEGYHYELNANAELLESLESHRNRLPPMPLPEHRMLDSEFLDPFLDPDPSPSSPLSLLSPSLVAALSSMRRHACATHCGKGRI